MPDTPARLAALGLADPPEALVAYVEALEAHAEALMEALVETCRQYDDDRPYDEAFTHMRILPVLAAFSRWQAEQARAPEAGQEGDG